jgi:aldose 1-epimerase
MTSPITLQCGQIKLILLPSLGGSISSFQFDNKNILRPWDGSDNVRKTASYPLVPFSNRMALGVLPCESEDRKINLNFGDHPHSIHGIGWQNSWEVANLDHHSCVLLFKHDAIHEKKEAWPFSFIAKQVFVLNENQLDMTLSVTNLDQEPMPVGLGWHPYFQQSPLATVEAPSQYAWVNGTDSLPLQRVLCEGSFDFTKPRLLEGIAIDNCFEKWCGKATIQHPSWGLTVSIHSPNLNYLVMFTPPDNDDFIAIEPVTHLNNAAHQKSPENHGWQTIKPGASISHQTLINIEKLSINEK